jgi:apolipoprotein N-acyltransferase
VRLKNKLSDLALLKPEAERLNHYRGIATLSVLLALLYSGLVQALISPPLNWTLLHVLSWVPAFWVFSRLSGHLAFLSGWLVGTSANLAIFYWLMFTTHNFLGMPVLLTPVVLLFFAAGVGFYVAVFAWGFQRIYRSVPNAWPFAIAAWFCALEFLTPQLFTYYQGAAWYQQPHLFLVSSLTGVSGISFLVIVCNAIALQAIEVGRGGWKQRRTLFTNVVVFSLLLLLTFAYSMQRLTEIERAETDAKSIEIALIQPNYTVERKKKLHRQSPDSFARDLVELSREIAAMTQKHIDVYVWPENALSKSPAEASNRQVINFARKNKAEIWTGALFQDSRQANVGVYRNSAFRIDANGEIDTRYDKTLLIPFGEYVPLKGILPGLDRIRLPGNFEAGDGLKILSSELSKFSFLICYEAIKSAYVRVGIQGGTELLVNISGDARSGDHSEQSQHLMLAAIQAAQFGVPLVRSTSTGISAFVDARGLVTAQTNVYDRGGLVQSVQPLRVPSIYAQYGDWFAWICVGVSIFLLSMGDRLTIFMRRDRSIRVN